MFERVIGYSDIKKELAQIADMIKNPQKYEEIGAKLTHGVLLYGEPGLGKSLMCTELISEVGMEAYTIRRNKSSQEFMREVSSAFEKAKSNSPCIVFLDDLDKFSNSDEHHRYTQEFVTVQTCIDEVRDKQVFVLATANDIDKLPDSLIRAGRFDRKIEVDSPTEEDAGEIIRYYLSSKKVSPDINYDDLTKMFYCSSCAELESILNEASVSAAYDGKAVVEMSDLVRAILKLQYAVDNDCFITSEERRREVAYHEAGHLLVSELLEPGSVGLACIKGKEDRLTGFVHNCKKITNRRQSIQIYLAGKVAVETFIGGAVSASGCMADLKSVCTEIRHAITKSGTLGIGMLDVISTARDIGESDAYTAQLEGVIKSELERNIYIVRDMLLSNHKLLDKIAQELMKRGTLLFSEIQDIKAAINKE